MKSASINGYNVGLDKPFNTGALISNTIFTLILQGEAETKELKIEIIVKPEIRTEMISVRPWHLGSLDKLYKDDNKWYSNFDLTQRQKEDSYYFYKDGDLKVFHTDGTSAGSAKWKWLGPDSIEIGDQKYTYIMTDTSLVLYHEVGENKLRDVYWREKAPEIK